ncbi:Ig-like domain-containing protein [Sphingomonas sp. AR_OL41]|uniref:Ig-like domain-containing protein n=1 Tax=Sphingomonas sp. AR_OL41 TaxID=3042729 RepID=UPI002480D0D5|nr:Ig-like domain-containing protein [Sphingomonas sp. AR_OL41]MDH7972867.1 Ig-like domain-containing protein [Sphingomonas sp. AR_OL41]
MRRIVSSLIVLGALGGCSSNQNPGGGTSDTEAPHVSIAAPGSVDGGETIALTTTVTDNVDRNLTAVITCTGGTLTGTILATTAVAADTSITCTATATDAAGNRGSGMVTIQVKASTVALSLGEGQSSVQQGQAGLLVASNLALSDATYTGALNGKAIKLYRATTTGLSFLVPADLAPGTYPLTVTVGTRMYSYSLTVVAAPTIPDAKAVVADTLTGARTSIDDFLAQNGAAMTSEQAAQYAAYRKVVTDALATIDTLSQSDLAALAIQFKANALAPTTTQAATGTYSIELCNTSANLFVSKNVRGIALIGLAAALFTAPEPITKLFAAAALGVAIGNLALPGGVLSEITKVAASCYSESAYTVLYDSNVQGQSSQMQFVRAVAATTPTGFRNNQPTNLRLQQSLTLDAAIAGKVSANIKQLTEILGRLPFTPDTVKKVLDLIVPEKTAFVPANEVTLANISSPQITGKKSGSGDVVTLTFSAAPSDQNIDFTFTLNRSNGTPIPLSGTLILNAPTASDAAFEVIQGKSTQTTIPIRGATSIDILTQPAHGTVTLTSDGLLTYIPSGQYFGADQFTYRARNSSATSASATVMISVVRKLDGFWRFAQTVTAVRESRAGLCKQVTDSFDTLNVNRITDTSYTVDDYRDAYFLSMASKDDPLGLKGTIKTHGRGGTYAITETLALSIPDSTHIKGTGSYSWVEDDGSFCDATLAIDAFDPDR